MDPKNPKGPWFLTGQGRVMKKPPNGPLQVQEGTWGPIDPKNPKGPWFLTGHGRRIERQSNGSQIIHEGTWAPMDPKSPKGAWILTGQGRIVREAIGWVPKNTRGNMGAKGSR